MKNKISDVLIVFKKTPRIILWIGAVILIFLIVLNKISEKNQTIKPSTVVFVDVTNKVKIICNFGNKKTISGQNSGLKFTTDDFDKDNNFIGFQKNPKIRSLCGISDEESQKLLKQGSSGGDLPSLFSVTINNPQPQIKDSLISISSNNKKDVLTFKKVAIKDLLTIASSGENMNHPFVEYQATVLKKQIYHYKNIMGETLSWYVIGFKDGSDYSFSGIDPTDNDGPELLKYYSKINVGDKVIVRGLPVKLADCNTNNNDGFYPVVQSLCTELHFKTILPETMLFLPNPKIGDNKQPIEIISSSPTPQTPTFTQPTQPTQNPTPVAINYSSYSRMQIDQYAKNPPAYLGVGIELTGGIVSDFLAKGDRGGSTNYIEVENGMDPSLDKLEIQVNSNSDYQNIISQLNKGDFINVFGLGTSSHSFTTTNGGTVIIPVISVQKIEKCQPYDCREINTTIVFSK